MLRRCQTWSCCSLRGWEEFGPCVSTWCTRIWFLSRSSSFYTDYTNLDSSTNDFLCKAVPSNFKPRVKKFFKLTMSGPFEWQTHDLKDRVRPTWRQPRGRLTSSKIWHLEYVARSRRPMCIQMASIVGITQGGSCEVRSCLGCWEKYSHDSAA